MTTLDSIVRKVWQLRDDVIRRGLPPPDLLILGKDQQRHLLRELADEGMFVPLGALHGEEQFMYAGMLVATVPQGAPMCVGWRYRVGQSNTNPLDKPATWTTTP